MDRVWKSGASGSPPSASENASVGFPTAGNPGTGTPATKPGPYLWYMLVEEILAVIEEAGITPAKTDTGQLLAALQSQGLFGTAAAADEAIATVAIAANVLTLNLNANRAFEVSFDANITTTTIQNPPANNKFGGFILDLTADGSVRTWAWATSTVQWDGDIAPTFTVTSGKHDVFFFYTTDGGSTWRGVVINQNVD